MLKSFSAPSLHATWRGRRPRRMHPRLLFAVRRDLAILHASLSLNDLKTALGNRLELRPDQSVPFDEVFSVSLVPEEAESELHTCQLHVGYGWRLCFEFRDGEAHDVRLEVFSRYD